MISFLLLLLQSIQVPAPTGMVNDFANVIPAEQQSRMERLAASVRGASAGEIAVVTLPTIEGRDVGQVALEIGRAWGVGAQGSAGDPARNAGVVLLIAIEDRAVSVQVGRGAEGFLNDARAGDIRREATPLLREGRYGDALELMEYRVAEAFAAEFAFSLDSALVAPVASERRGTRDGMGSTLFNVAIMFIFIVLIMSRMGGGGGRGGRGGRGGGPLIIPPFTIGRGGRGHGGGFGGGFGGGGFGGFGGGGGFGGFGGGGGFSGGGSSGGW